MLTVILTGGASRRMGRDKAQLPWKGETMCQSLINRYSVLGPVAVSVNRAGRFEFTNAMELVDEFPDMGPMNGIVSAFSRTEEDEIFLTATDLPYGQPELVEKLRRLAGDADACVMHRGVKGLEPLFAIYKRSCYAPALSFMREGRRSIMALLGSLRVRYVEESELEGFDLERILANVNTEKEYEEALKNG